MNMASRALPRARVAARSIAPRAQQVRKIHSNYDAWRKHPLVTNCKAAPFPGIGYAIVPFILVTIVDMATEDHGHGHGHGHGDSPAWERGEVGEKPAFVGGDEEHDEHH